MAKCKVCGKSGFFLKLDNLGRCKNCSSSAINSLSNGGLYNKTADEINRLTVPNYKSPKLDLAQQDKLLKSVWDAREQYKIDGDIDKLISVYEFAMRKSTPTLKGAQAHVFYLVDLYIKTKQYDEAWGYLNSISFEYIHMTHKIRKYQYKICKKEKRYTIALDYLLQWQLLKSQPTKTYSKDEFIKEATPIIKKLNWKDDTVEYLSYLIENQVGQGNFDIGPLHDSYNAFLKEIQQQSE